MPSLRVAYEEKEWDINVVPDGLSINEYRLLCIDLDSTLIETECLDILGDLVGRGDQMRTITQKAMTGKLRFEDSLRQRVELLKDSPASILEEALAAVKLSPGAEYLIDFVKSYGLDVWLFSGGLIELAAPIAERLGFAGGARQFRRNHARRLLLREDFERERTARLQRRREGPRSSRMLLAPRRGAPQGDQYRRRRQRPRHDEARRSRRGLPCEAPAARLDHLPRLFCGA